MFIWEMSESVNFGQWSKAEKCKLWPQQHFGFKGFFLSTQKIIGIVKIIGGCPFTVLWGVCKNYVPQET